MSVKRLMAFVEGQTEQEYVVSLLEHFGARSNLQIYKDKIAGQISSANTIQKIQAKDFTGDITHHACILDTGGDGGVVSRLRDNYSTIESRYDFIFGMRDVYPVSGSEALLLMETIRNNGAKSTPKARYIFAIAETEAWFIADDSHFEKLNPGLTPGRVLRDEGYDLLNTDPESVEHPCKLLKKIYRLEGIPYKKRLEDVRRTVSSLDHDYMRKRHGASMKNYAALCEILDEFFAT